jgi:hypothetical protein
MEERFTQHMAPFPVHSSVRQALVKIEGMITLHTQRRTLTRRVGLTHHGSSLPRINTGMVSMVPYSKPQITHIFKLKFTASNTFFPPIYLSKKGHIANQQSEKDSQCNTSHPVLYHVKAMYMLNANPRHAGTLETIHMS